MADFETCCLCQDLAEACGSKQKRLAQKLYNELDTIEEELGSVANLRRSSGNEIARK